MQIYEDIHKVITKEIKSILEYLANNLNFKATFEKSAVKNKKVSFEIISSRNFQKI